MKLHHISQTYHFQVRILNLDRSHLLPLLLLFCTANELTGVDERSSNGQDETLGPLKTTNQRR